MEINIQEFYYTCPKCGSVKLNKPRLRKCRKCGSKITATGRARVVATDITVTINGETVSVDQVDGAFKNAFAPLKRALKNQAGSN